MTIRDKRDAVHDAVVLYDEDYYDDSGMLVCDYVVMTDTFDMYVHDYPFYVIVLQRLKFGDDWNNKH
jgi:hypothetical protein